MSVWGFRFLSVRVHASWGVFRRTNATRANGVAWVLAPFVCLVLLGVRQREAVLTVSVERLEGRCSTRQREIEVRWRWKDNSCRVQASTPHVGHLTDWTLVSRFQRLQAEAVSLKAAVASMKLTLGELRSQHSDLLAEVRLAGLSHFSTGSSMMP